MYLYFMFDQGIEENETCLVKQNLLMTAYVQAC